MTLQFAFGLLVFLGSAWLFLLTDILQVSTASPADGTLMALCFLHFLTLVYLVLAVRVLFRLGLRHTLPHEQSVVSPDEILLLETWPGVLASAAFAIVFARAFQGHETVMLVIAPLPAVGFTLLRVSKGRRHGLSHAGENPFPMKTFGFGVAIMVIGVVPYALVMSFLFASVSIKMDKDFYSQGEVLRADIRSSGYIFLPEIKSAEVQGRIYEGGSSNHVILTHTIVNKSRSTGNPLSEWETYPTEFFVYYEPQALGKRRMEAVTIAVTPK